MDHFRDFNDRGDRMARVGAFEMTRLVDIAVNVLICAIAVPMDCIFLVVSTLRLTRAGFGIVAAFKYSLNR